MVTLSDQFKKGSNIEFTVHFYLECKKAQNNFVPIFNSKVGVRLIQECDLSCVSMCAY